MDIELFLVYFLSQHFEYVFPLFSKLQVSDKKSALIVVRGPGM